MKYTSPNNETNENNNNRKYKYFFILHAFVYYKEENKKLIQINKIFSTNLFIQIKMYFKNQTMNFFSLFLISLTIMNNDDDVKFGVQLQQHCLN